MNNETNISSILKTNQLEIGYVHGKRRLSIASEINFSVEEGELVGIIGVNGAGKSTLLKTLTNELNPMHGSILIKNIPLEKYSNKQLSELFSLVLTNQTISKNLSVFELVALGRQPYTNWIGNLAEKDKLAVNQALKEVDLIELQHKKCHELSDGQLQKTLIARALAQNTPFIFMDEPTTHLDLYHKAYVLQLLKKLTKTTKKAIIFASHELNLSIQLCDTIILLQEGKTIVGKPDELIDRGVFDSLFPSDLIEFNEGTKSFQIKNEIQQ